MTLAALVACLVPRIAAAYVEAPPFRWHEGYFRLSAVGSYYQTTANYTENRNEYQALTNGNTLRETDARLRARYNLADWVSTYVSGNFVDVQTRDSVQGNKDNATVADSQLGFDFLLLDSSWRMVAEFEGSYAIDAAKYNRTSALGSDGVNYLRGSLFMLKPLRWFNLLASAGAKARDEGMAAQFLWSAAVEIPIYERFLFGIGLDGNEALVSDSLYPRDRKQLTDRVNAGSYRHYAFNDALMQAGAWIGWAPIPALQLRAGYEQSLTGQRAAAGSAGFLALSWNFDPRPDTEGFSARAYARQRAREDQRGREGAKNFETTDEATSDSLFYDDVPKKTPRRRKPDPLLEPDPGLPAQYSPRGAPLDDAEKSLERRK